MILPIPRRLQQTATKGVQFARFCVRIASDQAQLGTDSALFCAVSTDDEAVKKSAKRQKNSA
jgi:hypothetical protein